MIRDHDLPNLDAQIGEMSSDLRHDIAEHGKNDLFFFAKAILGYRDMTLPCHGPMCTFLADNPARFKLLLYPRGHFKTHVGIAKLMQLLCRNPENRLLLANETATNAERFLGAIKIHFERNKRFRTLYSSIIPKDFRKTTWSRTEIVVNRQGTYTVPSIDTIGMTGAWTSRHYTHIDFDDPISEEAAGSERVMHDVISRISKVFSLMDNVEVDTFDLIGTRWAFYDVYTHMIRWLGPKLAKMVRGAIEDGEPIFPERFSLETLAQIRDAPEMGEYLFSCQYYNNPRDVTKQDFNVQDLRFWRWSNDEKHVVLYDKNGEITRVVPFDDLDVTCVLDPAPAETIGSDRNAITTCGSTPDGDIVVLDVWARRCTPLEVMDQLFRIKQRYSPRVFGVEGVAYQRSIKYHLRAEAERRQEYINVRDLKAPGKNKQHIKGLQPIAATGHLYLLPTQHLLRNELAEYPLGEFDDTADSLALHQQLWRGVVSPDRWNKYKESERRLLADIDGYGLRSDQTRPSTVATNGARVDPRDVPHPDDLGIEPEQAPIYAVEFG